MSLNDDGIGSLIAGSSRCKDDHIAHLVLNILQTALLGKVSAVVADVPDVAGAMGDAADIFKEFKNLLGLQMRKNSHNGASKSYYFMRAEALQSL